MHVNTLFCKIIFFDKGNLENKLWSLSTLTPYYSDNR